MIADIYQWKSHLELEY